MCARCWLLAWRRTRRISHARVGGSDSLGAALWRPSVDGLLVLATVGVRKAEQLSRRGGSPSPEAMTVASMWIVPRCLRAI